MKAIILLTAIIIVLFSSCKNSDFKYGTSPIQLENIPFDINIPNFLADEKIFSYDNDNFTLVVDENKIDIENNDSTLYYIQFNLGSVSSDNNLADYKKFKFKTLEFISDIEEKMIWVWMAKQDTVSSEDISQLLDDINTDHSNATISYKDMKDNFNAALKIVWRTKDRIIKLTIPNLEGIELEDPRERNYYDYQYEEAEEEKEPYSKAQLITEFKRKLKESDQKNDIVLFIVDPTFDKIHTENRAGSSGTMTNY